MPKMLCIGTGPGPKNVLVLLDDGTKTVVSYKIWKQMKGKRLADKQYVTAEGFVQFDVKERSANGQDVLDLTLKTPGTEGILIRCTLWPEMRQVIRAKYDAEPVRGDWVAIDGTLDVQPFQGQDGSMRQSVQINVGTFAMVPGVRRPEREVVNQDVQPADAETRKKLF